MNDERFLKEWLRGQAPDESGTRDGADRIMARLPEVRQRSRWWPLPLVRSFRPRPTDDDRSPNVSGRTRSMFTPATAVTVGALALAMGGLFLVASPANEPGAPPEASVGLAVPPSLFRGEVAPVGPEAQLPSASRVTREDGSYTSYGYGYEGSLFQTDDQRISGSLDWIWNEEGALPGDATSQPIGAIATVLVRVTNDQGSWSGATTWVNGDLDSGLPGSEVLSGWLTGAGAYEGLVAYMTVDTDTWKVMGAITPSGPPPAPEGFPSDSEE